MYVQNVSEIKQIKFQIWKVYCNNCHGGMIYYIQIKQHFCSNINGTKINY